MYRKRFDSDCVVLLRVLRPSFLVSILDLACYVESSHFSALLRHLRRGCVVDAICWLWQGLIAIRWPWHGCGAFPAPAGQGSYPILWLGCRSYP